MLVGSWKTQTGELLGLERGETASPLGLSLIQISGSPRASATGGWQRGCLALPPSRPPPLLVETPSPPLAFSAPRCHHAARCQITPAALRPPASGLLVTKLGSCLTGSRWREPRNTLKWAPGSLGRAAERIKIPAPTPVLCWRGPAFAMPDA